MRLKRVEKLNRISCFMFRTSNMYGNGFRGKTSLKQSVDVSDDLKDRLKQIIGRIEKLEIYSTKQTDITSNLQKHIVDADK